MARKAAGAAGAPPPPAQDDPIRNHPAFREVPDRIEMIALERLDKAPWNPKKPITGKFKKGLSSSLDYFGNRDALKVWPNPREPGRYVVLNGNQRLGELIEKAQDVLTDQWLDVLAARLGIKQLDPDDPEFGAKSRAIRSAALADFQSDTDAQTAIRRKALAVEVKCWIIPDLDPADAKAFTAAWDRNHAVYDESRQLQIAQDIIKEGKDRAQEILDRILRPDTSFVPAPTISRPDFNPASVTTGDASPESTAAPEGEPTEEEPWGPPPPSPATENAYAPTNSGLRPNEGLIPFMFSVTPGNYAKLTEGILKSKSRLVRESRLLEAVERLAAADDSVDLDEPVVELALMIVNERLRILKVDEAE